MLLSLTTANGPVSYSRNKNHYNMPARYRSRLFTHAKVTQGADYVTGQGLVIHDKVKPGNLGWQSSLMAKPDTMARVSEILRMGPKLEAATPSEIIELRDEAGKKADYQENFQIRTMRTRLAAMNEAIRATLFTGVLPNAMIRIFNKSFNRGGRFYALGGSWQSMSKHARKQIQINGEPVVEIDYSTLHPALIYAQAGVPMPDDCYDIHSWPRDLVKRAVLILINVRTENGARTAIAQQEEMRLLARPNSSEAHRVAKELIADIKARHWRIADAFHSDRGIELQRLDGDLAEAIMHIMLAANVVVLPVHDSFLVQKSQASRLEETMLRVAYEAGYESLRAGHA